MLSNFEYQFSKNADSFKYSYYKNIATVLYKDFKCWEESQSICDSDKFFHHLSREVEKLKHDCNAYSFIKKISILVSPVADKSTFLFLYEVGKSINKHQKLRFFDFREFGFAGVESPFSIEKILLNRYKYKTASKKHNIVVSFFKVFSFVTRLYIKALLKGRFVSFSKSFEVIDSLLHKEYLLYKTSYSLAKLLNETGVYCTKVEILDSLLFIRKNLAKLTCLIAHEKYNNLATGIPKLLKVILGVTIYSLVFNKHGTKKSRPINLTIKIAYYWGITYPLIDDLIDSPHLKKEEKANFYRLLIDIFSGKMCSLELKSYFKDNVLVSELVNSLSSLMLILPYSDNEKIYRFMRFSLVAHIKDNSKQLHQYNYSNDIYPNLILKAALVRITTCYISGADLTNEQIKNIFLMSLFNQEEDDLQDIYEDLKNKRATPFTLFYKNNIDCNPLVTFYKYMIFLFAYSDKIDTNSLVIARILIMQFFDTIKRLIEKEGVEACSKFIKLFSDNDEIHSLYDKILHRANGITFISETLFLAYFELFFSQASNP